MLLVVALLAPALAGNVVRPQFGWAPGDAWTVEFERVSQRSGSAGERTVRTRSSWTMTVSGTPADLRVVASGYRFDGGPGRDEGSEGYTAAMVAAGPSFRVGAGGALLELLDLPSWRQTADTVLSQATSLPADVRARLKLPDSQVRALVDDWWDGLVDLWRSGDPLVIGQPERLTLQAPVPVLGNRLVQNDVSRTYAGPAACAEGQAPTCEQLTLSSSANPGALAVAIEEYTARVAGDAGPAVAFRRIDLRSELKLLTEADDLRPRRLWVERSTRMEGTAGGKPVTATQTDTRTWTFTRR